MGDGEELGKRILDELDMTIEGVTSFKKLTSWGFASFGQTRQKSHLRERLLGKPHGKERGEAYSQIQPKNDGKFDLARAQEAVRELDFCIRIGRTMAGLENEEENTDVLALATRLCLAASNSLAKHSDLREAMNAMLSSLHKKAGRSPPGSYSNLKQSSTSSIVSNSECANMYMELIIGDSLAAKTEFRQLTD